MKDKTASSVCHTSAMQRSGVLAELAPLLRAKGIDPAKVFEGSGIETPPLSPAEMVPFAGALRVLDKAAEVTRCPHFGLLLGKRFRLAHHGIVGELMLCAPTLGRALRDFSFWQPGYSSGAVVYLHPLGNDYAFGYAATSMGSPILYDLAAAIGLRMVQQLTGGTVLPEEIHFPCRRPPDRSAHVRLLKVPIRFNEQRVCIVLSAAALETRLPGADHARYRAVLGGLRAKLHRARPEAAARTRQVLRILLQQGPPSMAAAAAELAMHPRTLRRRLAEEQTSFEALCEKVRFDMACELLDFTDLTASDIGSALAYASPSVFADAFRRWTGSSPLAFRRRNVPLRPASAQA